MVALGIVPVPSTCPCVAGNSPCVDVGVTQNERLGSEARLPGFGSALWITGCVGSDK